MLGVSARARVIFEKSGWFEGRCVDVSHKVKALEQEGWLINPFALEFLKNFDELKISQPALPPSRDDIEIDPLDLVGDYEIYGEWQVNMNMRFLPIGRRYAYRLFIDYEGIIYEDGYGTMYRLGSSFEECVNELFFGSNNWVKLGSLKY
ncbi:MAG: SUKH-3 domain-containing protein [Pseudopedobacter sp.]|nr:SUKH-3 domain-containing protein [Deinococcales bacterium]